MLTTRNILVVGLILGLLVFISCTGENRLVNSPDEDNNVSLGRTAGSDSEGTLYEKPGEDKPVGRIMVFQADDCYIKGSINKPFWLDRTGNQYIVMESDSGGIITVTQLGEPTMVIETDGYLKISITGFYNGFFFPPLLHFNYEGWIHVRRAFIGGADHIRVEWSG